MSAIVHRPAVVAGPATGFANTIDIGPHHWLADEPIEASGTDTGPAPFEILAASLGACTSMTLGVYARFKKLPLEHVSVEVQHDTVDGKDRLRRSIKVTGPLSDEQRAKLLEIANKCPVHKALQGGPIVETQLA